MNFSSSPLQLHNLSLQILQVVAPWSALQLIVSSFQLISVLVILLAIVSSATLRRNETFIILANIVVNDSVWAIGNVINSSVRLWAYQTGMGMPSIARSCMNRDMPRIWSYTNTNGFLMALALYRLIGVAAPVWYQRHNSKKLLCGVLVVMYVRTAPICALYLISVNDNPVPLCGYLAVQPWAAFALSAISTSWTTLTAIAYVLTIVVTYVRLGIVRWNQGSVTEARKHLQVQIIWTLALILAVHLSSTTIGNALLVIAGNSPSESNFLERNYVAVTCSGTVIALDSTLYLLILVCRCADFRGAVVDLGRGCRRKNAVENLGMQKDSKNTLQNNRGSRDRGNTVPVRISG